MEGYKESDTNSGFLTKKEIEVKLPRGTRVKNKTPAQVQITAKQILLEACERYDSEIHPPKRKITDSTELADYQLLKRMDFEDKIRRVRWNPNIWIKYVEWEESQKDFNRARSVWERALEVDYKSHTLWLKYAEMEMKNKFVDHARNVLDRAVTLLPRVDQLWYKYIHMEEMLGNIAGSGQIFERWMQWQPDEQGWLSYIKFEQKYNETDRAGGIYERFVQCHPKAVAAEQLFVEDSIEDSVLIKKRLRYEENLKENTLDYDSWFEFIWLEHSVGVKERIREIYRRAIANIPPADEKRYWQRYIYLWINYALYEELDAEDTDQAREVYRECLKLIPHKKFSFAKI